MKGLKIPIIKMICMKEMSTNPKRIKKEVVFFVFETFNDYPLFGNSN